MTYDDDYEVKDVAVTFLVKMKARMTLLGADYNKSDGTDADAFVIAFNEDGVPDWDAMELHEVLSIREVK
jgi:hypothetical protein